MYLGFWLLLFVLYFPAREAGFVSDYTGWLYDLQHSSFADHINRKHFVVQSLYQLSQLTTWALFQVLGTHAFLWHLVHISLHALNCLLLFRFVAGLGLPEEKRLYLWIGCLLLCVRSGLSEVIVWEASFHYLLGSLLLLLVLRNAQLWLVSQRIRYAIAAGVVYALSTFSIELFYVTPLMVLMLLPLVCRKGPAQQSLSVRFICLFTLPQALLLLLHFSLVHLFYGTWLPHISADNAASIPYTELFARAPRWLINELLQARFMKQEWRDRLYGFFGEPLLTFLFWGIWLLVILELLNKRRPAISNILLYLHAAQTVCLLLISPLNFPSAFEVVYDRYSYFFSMFLWPELALFLSLLSRKLLRLCSFGVLLLVQGLFAIRESRKWGRAQDQIRSLISGLPDHTDKKVLLLNMPHSIDGIYMIPPNPQNEAQLLRNLLYKPINYELIDVAGNNIHSFSDGAHARVVDDSTVDFALNQWATWWWYDERGLVSRETPYFRLESREYDNRITLKGNPDQYLLLFQVGDHWKKVDMRRKGVDQY
ncbi:MAG: hypothetical protein QM743_02205 [Chitinophagaceae bacterium]